ncbi:MAG TPA: cyanophycinase [Gemmatimonadaceae bacterium]|nr:cyanophycinase [Gemmatimonadaceae bacterium]
MSIRFHNIRAVLRCVALAVAVGACTPPASSRPAAAARAGAAAEPRGSLVIVGGGPRVDPVMRRFVELAGGAKRARVVVFPMASELPETGPESVEEFRRMGVRAVSVPLTHEQALDPAAAHALDSATGIWFPGGDQVRLMHALSGTPVADTIRARYRAGAVVGGTSAGAAVMSTPMITGDERAPGGARRDTTQAFITIARDDIVLGDGLGLIPGAIIDQHFLRRRRHNRLVSVVLEHPQLVGIGIDESTALVVQPGRPWSVVGASAVVVYDARRSTITPPGAPALGAADIRMHVLPAGSTFDPASGEARLP